MENNNTEKKLILGHVFLYAKGWYKHSKYMWQDFRRCIIADSHYVPETLSDVATLLLRMVDENKEILLPSHRRNIEYLHQEIENKILDLQFTDEYKDMKPLNVYYHAIVMVCRNIFAFTDKSIFYKVLAPYEKVLPLNLGSVRDRDMTRKEAYKLYQEDIKNKLGADKWYDDEDDYNKRFAERFEHYYSMKDDIKEGKLQYEHGKNRQKRKIF